MNWPIVLPGMADKPPWFQQAAQWAVTAIETAGIGVLVVGLLIATVVFLARLLQRTAFREAYDHYRADLGHSILLGLEFLVAADIIGTVAIDLTFTSVGVLAIVVLIRTFLSFSLEAEIEGHWPWRGSDKSKRSTGGQN